MSVSIPNYITVMNGGRVDGLFQRAHYVRNDYPCGLTKILFMRATLRPRRQKRPKRIQHKPYYSPKALELKKIFDSCSKNKNARYLYIILQEDGRLDHQLQGRSCPTEPEHMQTYRNNKGLNGEVIAVFDLERHFDNQLNDAGVDPTTLASWERFRTQPLNGIIKRAALPAPPEVPLIMGPREPTLVFQNPDPT